MEKAVNDTATTSAIPLTAAQAGLVSCETCALLSRPADPAEPGYCPRCGDDARLAPPPLHPVHLGAAHRRGDLFYPRQRSAGAEHDHARFRRCRKHHGRRGVSLHFGIVAARADRADRQRDDPARQAGRARLSADHGAARLDSRATASAPGSTAWSSSSAAGRCSMCSSTLSPSRWCSSSR